MHSTSSWIEASPEKVSVIRPPGASPGSKLTASSDRTLLPLEGFTFFSLAPNTRSNSERRALPPVILPVAARFRRLLPNEPVDDRREALLRGQIGHVGDPHHRVLKKGRHDGEILLVKGDEFQFGHGNRAAFGMGLPCSGMT